MVLINPIDVLFWTFRRSERDVINLYTTLSPVMQAATGGSMLNFGYWSSEHRDPISAQSNLCSIFGDLADLSSARCVVDVGSGLSSPSRLWHDAYPNLRLYDININLGQLRLSGKYGGIGLINSTATRLPFSDSAVDRVLALESAQHFRPLEDFVSESKRILSWDGILALAVPVVTGDDSVKSLGLLKFTWSSEHYTLDYLRDTVLSAGFTISDEQLIGSDVYVPLADYYMQNRSTIKKSILTDYPKYVERILFWSIQKMKRASEENVINYVLLKCRV